jgi:RNA polymerase sigma-70 factor (ECF subfamily)
MTEPSANALVTALATGQPGAYAVLYDRVGPILLRVARVMLGAADQAEDAVQDVFVELVRQRDRLGRVVDLDAYLFAMLRHGVWRRLKRHSAEQEHLRRLQRVRPAATSDPEPSCADELSLALKTLPAEQREVIALKIDADLTFAQIADILGVNPNTAASRYRYALEKFRRILEP